VPGLVRASRGTFAAVSRYRFLVRPRWLVFTVVIALLVVTMVNLAFWQLRRLDEKRDRNDRVVEREAEPTANITEIVGPDASPADVAAAEWRRATATGSYDEARQVLIRNRDYAGHPGYHVVTPLRLSDGRAVLVNRGWVPLETTTGKAPAVPPPPSGNVTVTGRVLQTQHRGRFFSPRDPPDGTLSQLYRVDVPRIEQQLPYPLVPAYLELLTTDPSPAAPQPELVPPLVLDEGPHLSYAIQWFFFSALAIAGWVLAMRHSARSRKPAAAPTSEDPAPAT
jgi:surfeit locus 1 family protein